MTHEMQPAVFGRLKIPWRNACHDFMQANPGKVITKYQFSSLLNAAWMNAIPLSMVSRHVGCIH